MMTTATGEVIMGELIAPAKGVVKVQKSAVMYCAVCFVCAAGYGLYVSVKHGCPVAPQALLRHCTSK